MKAHKLATILLISATVLGLCGPSAALAAQDPNYLLSDSDLTDFTSMSLAGIQQFLESKKSPLAYVVETDVDGLRRRAAEIIWRVSRTYRISPKVLITLLQKEQSLIEDSSPSVRQMAWATGYAVCDACSTADSALQKFRGYAPQLDSAAARFRTFLDKPETRLKHAGIAYTIDGVSVTPATLATAILYTYTPHLAGNLNFATIWQKYFGKRFPDGSLLKAAGDPKVWFVEHGERRHIGSMAVLASRFDPSRVIETTLADIEQYPEGRPLRFPNYSLLRDPAGTVYLLVDEVAHPIVGRETMRTLGFNPEEILEVTADDMAQFANGSFITVASAYPTGAVLKAKLSGKLFYVENGTKYPIADIAIARANFLRMRVAVVSDKELAQYFTKEPVRFRDGAIVGDAQTKEVFIIAEGRRRAITLDALKELSIKEEQVVWTTAEALLLHDASAPLE